MAYNYVCTAQKPTTVTHSLTGAFTGPDDLNLIIIKSTRMEIHQLGPEGLIAVLDTPLYGRVATAMIFRPQSEKQDLLFISTERYQFSIMSYDSETSKIITRAMGSLKEGIGQPLDNGQVGIVDPMARMIGLHLYEGQLKIIPMQPSGKLLDSFNVRLEEVNVVDMKFLHGYNKPTVAVLYMDQRSARHIKTYSIGVREKESTPGPWTQLNVEKGANMLIPVPAPLGGVLIVGAQTLTYHNGTSYKAIPIQTTRMCAYGVIDENGERYLLGDTLGQLFLVVLNRENKDVHSLHLEVLGETSCARTISYLDKGMVFVGSSFGDSQVVRLQAERDESGSYVKVESSVPNLGPIVDMCIVDMDRQGQSQLVTCSGVFKDGSLRCIRNGIGISMTAELDVAALKGIWSLRKTSNAEFHNYLVQGFSNETRIMGVEEEGLSESPIPGFVSGRTLVCANMAADLLLQVTEQTLRLASCESLQCVYEWKPPQGTRITVAAANATQVVLALTGGELVHLELNRTQKTLEEKARCRLEHEVTCLTVNPLAKKSGSKGGASAMDVEGEEEGERSEVLGVGMWEDLTVRLLALPTLQQLVKTPVGGDTQSRSILLVTLEEVDYLLVGLGDGHLVSFPIQTPTDGGAPWLGPCKKVSLGTHPITLTPFNSGGLTNVFAGLDRPTVVYSRGNKLQYANVNTKEVVMMTPFHSELSPDNLALASEQGLAIGSIDEIQKLQITPIPLGESPRRIAYCAEAKVFAVCTSKYVAGVGDATAEEEQNYVRFFDQTTFDTMASYELRPYELALSIMTATFAKDPREYVVVGTGITLDEEQEPSEGRILVFALNLDVNGAVELQLVSEKATKGAVYVLNAFNGKLLAGINSKVQLYRWAEKDGVNELQTECGHHGHILCLYLQSRGDFIVVGDLMRSISLLQYKESNGTIEEIANDYSPHWMTGVDMIDDDTFIGAENCYHVFTVRKNGEAPTDEDRKRLEPVGEYHVGEFINKFCKGSLVLQPRETEASGLTTGGAAAPLPASASSLDASQSQQDAGGALSVVPPQASSLLFGTVSGMIGVILPLSEEAYRFFLCLSKAMSKVVKGTGGLSQEDWRKFHKGTKVTESRHFIDGDLVESFLDLSRNKMEDVVAIMQAEEGWTAAVAPTGQLKEDQVRPPTTQDGSAMVVSTEGNDKESGGAAGGKAKLRVEDVYKRVEDMTRLH